MNRVARFWLSAVAVALLVAVGTAILFPYDALRLTTPADRHRVWLLTLWTGGVLCLIFGGSGLLGFATPLGVREVTDAGGVMKAVELRRKARMVRDGFHGNFACWLISTGAILIALYFIAWGSGIDVFD